jgi:hypothetical protein
MNTFLPPIENPPALITKLAYYFTVRQFGKVLTPLKVHSARLPLPFGLFYAKIANLDKKLLCRARLSCSFANSWRLNVCRSRRNGQDDARGHSGADCA